MILVAKVRMATPKPAILLLLIPLMMLSVGAYTTSMHAPAVLTNSSNETAGALTLIALNLTPGTGIVSVAGPASVASSTIASAQTAAAAASAFLGVNESRYNFNYTINDSNISVSGPSAGLVFTLLAISAMQHRQLMPNFTATGTISSSGDVGLIGGVLNKVAAAKRKGMGYVLVPAAGSDSFEYLLYYIAQQTYGIALVQVANVSQALPYAYGTGTVHPLPANLSVTYPLSAIGTSNVTCTDCNTSAFGTLVGFTLNFTNSAISSISGNFNAAKAELVANSKLYGEIANAGYLYTAADFSFLDFMQAFTLANAANYSISGASGVINNTYMYCSSLVPPPITASNYEYVLGGELRQYWANVTLSEAQQTLNASVDADGAATTIYQTASAVGWCNAAAELYSIAPINGTPVSTSSNLQPQAASAISKARAYGSSMYLTAALDAYNSGNYAVALYSATYAIVFGPSVTPNVSESQMYASTLANIANATSGFWPPQFASQSEFYLRNSIASNGSNASAYASQAYSTSRLAAQLENDNNIINASFVPAAGTGIASAQVLALEQSVSQLSDVLLINTLLLFVVLVVLLYLVLNQRKPERRRTGRAR